MEVGVTVARTGERVTGLERRELDQGQHDVVTDTLAVGSAGMLIRRDVWDQLDGFDPALPLFRDDIDFCWRARRAGCRVIVAPAAVLHHREAATHGRRLVDAGSPKHPERPARMDRIAAIHLMRSHAHGIGSVLLTVGLLVASLLRALGYLLGKRPDRARDEWGAFRDAVRDRSGLRASRTRVASASSQSTSPPPAEVRRWLAPRTQQLRHAWDRVGELIAGRDEADAECVAAAVATARVLEAAGHHVEPVDELPVGDHDPGGRTTVDAAPVDGHRDLPFARQRPQLPGRCADLDRVHRDPAIPGVGERDRVDRCGDPPPCRVGGRAEGAREIGGVVCHEVDECTGASAPDGVGERGVPAPHREVRRFGGGRPPLVAGADGHVGTTLDAATTPRKHASAASDAAAAVAGTGATSAICRSRSTSCFT